MTELFKDAFKRANFQLMKAMQNTEKKVQSFSGEEFKELFIRRANLAMIEHGTPGAFKVDDNNREALNMLYYHATGRQPELVKSNIGIILTGKYGSGKSIMMSAYCKVLFDLKIVDQRIDEIHAIALSEMIKNEGILPWAKKPLLIQDMGMEEAVLNVYGTKINPIGNLLAVRAEYGSLTFGSTNKKWNSLTEHYSEYVGARAKEMVNFIPLKGDSRRKNYVKKEAL